MTSALVETSRSGAILEVVLNRPEKRNALNAEMIAMVRAAFAEAASDASVNVVLVRAEGPDFCAGFDLATVDPQERQEARAARERDMLFDFSLGIRAHPSPTVALVQGANVAAGLLISQACDLVVTSDDAFFYDPLPRMGGVGLEVLWEPFDLGYRRAKRVLFTGSRISAADALAYGMVTDVVPRGTLLEFGRDLAGQVAALPPETLKLLKRSLNAAQDTGGMPAAQDAHFALHQLGHQTEESRRLLHENRRGRELRDYFAERDARKSSP